MALCLLAVAGCATYDSGARFVPTGDALADTTRALERGPRADRVMWLDRGALAAVRAGRFDLASRWLDEALSVIEGVYGPEPSAKKARSLFHPESSKVFIGEPYERVMAYYYRGMLYWAKGEWDNARACFRSAEIHDSDPANHKYQEDYVLLPYLDGLASLRLGGGASEFFLRATHAARLAVPPPYHPSDNVLVFVEYGSGPSKYATGVYGEELRFHAGSSLAREVIIRTKEASIHLGPYDDLSFQATTRGGRVMDHILANKAVFKRSSDVLGDAAIISGAVLAQNRGNRDAGLGLVAFGLVSKILSGVTVPRADTRSWTNLPNYLTFGTLSLSPGSHHLSVEFLDQSGQSLTNLNHKLRVEVAPPPQDTVVYISDRQPKAKES